MSTTETPAAPMERRISGRITRRPPMEMATVRAEKTTVRPAVRSVFRIAFCTTGSRWRRFARPCSASSTAARSSSR